MFQVEHRDKLRIQGVVRPYKGCYLRAGCTVEGA